MNVVVANVTDQKMKNNRVTTWRRTMQSKAQFKRETLVRVSDWWVSEREMTRFLCSVLKGELTKLKNTHKHTSTRWDEKETKTEQSSCLKLSVVTRRNGTQRGRNFLFSCRLVFNGKRTHLVAECETISLSIPAIVFRLRWGHNFRRNFLTYHFVYSGLGSWQCSTSLLSGSKSKTY